MGSASQDGMTGIMLSRKRGKRQRFRGGNFLRADAELVIIHPLLRRTPLRGEAIMRGRPVLILGVALLAMAGCSRRDFTLTLPDVERGQTEFSAELIYDLPTGASTLIITHREPSGESGRTRHALGVAHTRIVRSNREFYLALSDGEKVRIPVTVTESR